MAYRVELTDRAEPDLIYIYAEVNAAESIAAARWFDEFEKAVFAVLHVRHGARDKALPDDLS